MEHNFVKAIGLKNNLQLKIYDNSKKMAGDRWLVSLLAQIKIPVDVTVKLLPDSDSDKQEITKLLGSEALFEQKRERFFINEKNKDSVLNELCDNFVESTINYLSHPDFPKKYVMMKFKEKRKKDLLEAAASQYRSDQNNIIKNPLNSATD
jgi:hypothetical protein